MRVPATEVALLALPALINAVSLSEMTPRASNLPSACNSVYTQQIPDCTATDFQSRDCSSGCISALEALVKPIQQACGNDGITGENLVVAFLAGVGPQQLCPNASPQSSSMASTSAADGATVQPSTTTTTSPTSTPSSTKTTPSPTIVSSTTTASSASDTSSLLVDTSSTMSQTMLPSSSSTSKTAAAHKSHNTQSTQSSASPTYTMSSSLVFAPTSTTTTSNGGASQTSSSSASSQTDLNDGSGGGSPFDSPGNMGSGASGLSIPATSILFSALAVLLASVR